MNSLMLVVAAASLSLDVGWQPMPEGGVEYIIQVEPQLLDTLKHQDVWSDVPPGLNIRRYRITVGTNALPRVNEPQPSAPAPIAASPPPAATLSPIDEKPASPAEPPRENTFDLTPAARAPNEDVVGPPKIEPAPSEQPLLDQAGALPGATGAPQRLDPPPDGHPLGGSATSFNEPSGPHEAKKPSGEVVQKSDASKSAPETTPQPWLPLVLTVLALSVSLGANVYLGWIAWGARHRYRALLDRFRGMPSPA